MIAGRAPWFYAGHLLWPVNLCFIYPQWPLNAGSWKQWLYPAAVVGAFLALWLARKRIGRGPVAAAFFFAGTLFPVLGFMNAYGMAYSYVWDHWVYLSSLGPIALAAAGMTIALGGLEKRNPFLQPALGGIVLLVLGLLTWRQAGMYADAETLWRTTIARNPNAWMAYDNLGILLSQKGETDEAMAMFEKTLAIRPNDALARNNLGLILCQKERVDEGMVEFQKALSILPDNAVFRNNLGKAFLAKGRQGEALMQFQKVLEGNPLDPKANYYLGIALFQTGRVDEALAHFQKALESQPDFAEAWDSLDQTAWLLATSPEASLRNGPKALALARQLARLSEEKNPALLDTLAAAYAENSQFPEAMAAAQKALALALSQNNTALANTLREHIESFQAGSPLRSHPPTDAVSGTSQP